MSTSPPRKRLSLFRRLLYVVLVLVGAACLWYLWPVALVPPKFTLSRETTFFTQPLDEEGYVNYQQAFNEKLSQGVTPENNAMVLLVKAIGPHPERSASLADEFYQRLGIPRLPDEGNYLVTINDYSRKQQWSDAASPEVVDDWMKDATQRPWKKEEFPRLAEWLERNQEPLRLIREAAQRQRYYAPLVFSPNLPATQKTLLAVLLPYTQKTRESAQMLIVRSMHAMARKEYQAAWEDFHAVLRLASMIAQGPTMIETMVANAMHVHVMERLPALLEATDVPLALIQQVQRDLQALPAMPSLADKLSNSERCMALDVFLMINRYGASFLDSLSGNGEFQPSSKRAINRLRQANWDAPLKRVNSWFDRLANYARAKSRREQNTLGMTMQVEMIQMRQRLRETRESWGSFFRSSDEEVDLLADTVIATLTPALQKVQLSADKAEQYRRLGLIAVRLALHQRTRGSYPKSLSELAPPLDATVLTDVFSDLPVLYRLTDKGYLLYSVGRDQGDDHAVGIEYDPTNDDLVFEIPRPQPQAQPQKVRE